jgi:hypothetical protein
MDRAVDQSAILSLEARVRLEVTVRLLNEPSVEVIESVKWALLRIEGHHHEITVEERRLKAEVAVLQYEARSRGALLQANAFLEAQSTSESVAGRAWYERDRGVV